MKKLLLLSVTLFGLLSGVFSQIQFSGSNGFSFVYNTQQQDWVAGARINAPVVIQIENDLNSGYYSVSGMKTRFMVSRRKTDELGNSLLYGASRGNEIVIVVSRDKKTFRIINFTDGVMVVMNVAIHSINGRTL